MNDSLALVAVTNLFTAVAFLFVARTLRRRPVATQDRPAAAAFVTWWLGMAAYLTLRAVLTAYAALTEPAAWPFLVGRAITSPLLAVAVWGLTYHILYVYTGRRRIGGPLAGLYGVLGVALFTAGFVPFPTAVSVQDWHVALEGEGDSALFRFAYVGIGSSIILAALAYLSLIPRVQGAQRWRIALVGTSIMLWVLSGMIAFLSANGLAKFVALVLLGLLVAAAVSIAYREPPDAREGPPREPVRHTRLLALRERARHLI